MNQENEDLKARVADLEARMDDKMAARFNEIVPSMAQSLAVYFANGGTGPLPTFSFGASNSNNLAPKQATAPVVLVTPAAYNGGAREESPAASNGGARSSPSISCTPALGPSTLAELDALTVIILASQASSALASYFIAALSDLRTCFGRRARWVARCYYS